MIEDVTTAIKSCSTECGVDAWPGPIDTTVSSCYRCPFEGQIYEFNIDTTKPVCACKVPEWKVAGEECVSEAFTKNFTEGNSQYSESIASQITYNSVETESASGDWTVSPQ